MTWDKPKNARQWLLLFTPPALCVVSTLLGGLADPKEGNWIPWSLVGLLLATVTAFCLSIWLARVNTTTGSKIGCAILCFCILMIVTGTVSVAGCAAGMSVFSTFTIR